MSGFYIPPRILTQDDFKKAAGLFISPDGHSARYLVQTKLNPFSVAAMDQVNSITDTAHSAQPNTALSDAKISLVGIPAALRDTRDYYNNDLRFIVIATIVIVLLILIALLRAIVAPLYLICSVVISYLSALGIGVVMFQFILGQELHWTVLGLTFIILVAVGADYNMLLISRIRDESPHGVRFGVIRTVGCTGGVITAAGLIFAASMFGLLLASISMMVQAGFVLGMGILLDTFLVRTVTVPAVAALVGRANWWPSQFRPQVHKPVRRAERVSTSHHLMSDHHDRQTRVAVPPSVANRHRHGAHETHEDLTPDALPLFGTNAMPKQLVTNGLESAVECQMTANGKHSADTNGKQPLETNGQHPAGTNADRSAEERQAMLKARFRADSRNRRAACWRCGQAIDYDAPPQTPTAFEADHYHPVATRPWLAYDYTNLRPSHSKCNRARGSKPDALADTPDLAYTKYGEHPAETNGQQPGETNGHAPVTTPPVDASSEDERVNEPRWIGSWPTSDATFPVGAHNGHQPATTASVAPSSEADRLR
jgi:hypothetical protein